MRKFFVTAAEMRTTGIRVHEEITDQTKYFAPSIKDLMSRVRTVMDFREDCEVEGKYAEWTGDDATNFRDDVKAVDGVIALWKNRGRQARV